jgi:hypothetical protein
MKESRYTNWDLELGMFSGLLFGFRTYNYGDEKAYVLYLGFIDLCLTKY